MKTRLPIYGMLAEFGTAEQLIEAARRTTEAGYERVDAMTPYAVGGLDEALKLKPNRVPLVFLIGGLLGGISGFLMQVYAAVYSYPINVGGRPLYSWPAFIPITFELTILGAGLAGAFGMIAMNGLPMPYHPVFSAPRFDLASQSRFFLCIEASDKKYDSRATAEFLRSLNALEVVETPE